MENFCIIITLLTKLNSSVARFLKYQFFCFSSSSFFYYCTCIAGCCTDTSIKCRIDSTNRNACKKCRFIKYQNSWIYIILLQILKYVHHSQEWYMLVKLWLNESFILFSLISFMKVYHFMQNCKSLYGILNHFSAQLW